MEAMRLVGGGGEGDLADDELLGAVTFSIRARTRTLPGPVVVLGDVDQAALEEVGVQLRPSARGGSRRASSSSMKLCGQDGGGHAHRDALGAEHEEHGHLGGQLARLLAPAVVAGDELGERLVEERLHGERREAALGVAGGRGLVAGEDVAEVALLLDEVVLVGQHHEGVADGGVAVGVQLHGLADDVGHLVELAVVHLVQGVEDAPLHRLAAVPQVGDGPVDDDVARVLEEVLLHQGLELAHGSSLHRRAAALRRAGAALDHVHPRLFTMNFLLSGVFLPMRNSRVLCTPPMDWIWTGVRRTPSAMNCLNSCGLISPRPLNRVTSALASSLTAVALRLAVAVDGLASVAHAEQRRLQDVDVALQDELLEVVQEVGEEEVPDVHAVHVRVGGDDRPCCSAGPRGRPRCRGRA